MDIAGDILEIVFDLKSDMTRLSHKKWSRDKDMKIYSEKIVKDKGEKKTKNKKDVKDKETKIGS